MAADLGLCPSARVDDPAMAPTTIFGIVGGSARAPRIDYLADPIPITGEMLEAWKASPIQPGEVFRASGSCKGERCGHWLAAQERCGLIDRWLTALEPGTELPRCAIRPQCRGWMQHGAEACRRCQNFASQTITGLADPLSHDVPQKVYL